MIDQFLTNFRQKPTFNQITFKVIFALKSYFRLIKRSDIWKTAEIDYVALRIKDLQKSK